MSTDEIRQTFLDFFVKKGHKLVPSAPLVPQDDPTLLFTNAGMVQFKKYFLGKIEPEFRRATSCQRCIRAGGKHNDLENVGKTSRHLTFFEMLGNFSFGDYFKREAIVWAWELVTEVFQIPPEKIWVTVFEEDDEAVEIWTREVGFPESKIVKMGKDENFWTMGDEGPAGPCSEIVLDRGEKYACSPECKGIYCDCDRFLEIWNLVFMQYNLRPDGKLEPLPRKNIDTGMGLERIASVLQNVPSNFDIDVFRPLSQALESFAKTDEVTRRVVLDASRTSAFAIADGIMPSNEGRGYVIRRIIRRALRYALRYIQKPFLNEISALVVDVMSGWWKHLSDKKDIIRLTVKVEEEKFFQTLARVIPLFEKEIEAIAKSGQKKVPGHIIFTFWDTHGLPPDIMQDVAREHNLELDLEGFEKEKTKRSKEQKKTKKQIFISRTGEEKSEFVGYELLEVQGTVTGVWDRTGKETSKLEGEGFISTDITPFYPEGGGQVGDTGVALGNGVKLKILDTQKLGDLIIHKVKVEEGAVEKGVKLTLSVDANRRFKNARHHTTTHLLHSALRKVLGTHVRQMGSLVAPEKLRFDFSHPVPLSESELKDIEDLVNSWILEDYPVQHYRMKFYDAISRGALAFFGDKYSDIVRVVEIGDVSLELCGGTHLRQTGEAGLFKIVKEGSVSAGIRRIEAVSGTELLRYIRMKEEFEKSVARILGISPADVLPRLRLLVEKVKNLEEEKRRLERELILAKISPEVREVEGIKVLVDILPTRDRNLLGNIVDEFKKQNPSSVVVVLGERDGGYTVVCGSTSRVGADDVVRFLGKLMGGGGGGRKDFAEGGTKTKLPKNKIISEIENFIKKYISG